MKMDNEPALKVRLVKCPKCRLLLPEPENVFVYQCGGCSTVLQVKKRNNDVRRRSAGLHGTEAAQMNESDCVSEVKDSISLSQRASLSSLSESSLDQNIERGQDISEDCISEKFGSANPSNEDQNDESCHNEAQNCNINQPGVSNKICSSSEIAHVGNEDSSQSNGANSEVEVDDESSQLAEAKSAIDVINESDPISRSSNAETSAVVRGSNSIVTYHRPAGDSFSSDVLMSSPDEQPKQLRCVRSNDASGANSEIKVSDGSSRFVEDKLAVDTDDKSDSISRKLNTKTSVVNGENNSTVTYHRPAVESDSSEVFKSSPEQLSTTFKHGYDCVRSNDEFEENLEVEVNDQSTHLAEAKPEVDIYNEAHESGSTSRSSNTEDAVVARENNSAVTSHRPAGEIVSSEILVSSPDEQQKQLRKNSDRVRSSDAFDANSEVEVNDQSSQLVEAKSAVEVSNFRSFNTENTVVAANVTSHTLAGERVSSEILVSSPDEQPKPRLWTSSERSYDHLKSNDTFDSTSFFSPSSELSTIDYMSKSPTTRSAHAYDGSVSSFDGVDDQVPDQQINSYGNPNKFVSSVVSEERTRRDKFPVNGNPEMQHHMRINLLPSDKRHYAMNHRKWDRDELQDSTRHGHAVLNGTRFERDEFQSPAHLYPRDYLAGYETGSTSSQLQNEFHNHFSEQEKIKLLRMVYELQEQLKRTDYVNENASYQGSSEVSAKEKYVPTYYSREITDEEISCELNYHRYPEKHWQGNNWSHQYKYSCIPFSGEVSKNRHCFDSSCLHCCPQGWQYSTRLPPPTRSQSRGFCTSHPSHNSYSSHRSCSSSPQPFTDSEYPICYRETKSDDQRHEAYHVKRHTKEQFHLVKRHLRPTAGGAPFVVCYRCLKPLQLPADFLLFKRRFHQLKCGACSEVLRFSLENRIHIVPYTPKAEAPLQSEVVDYRDAVNRRILSSSFSSDYPQADPVSCSDDYGLSHGKSYSTDGDPVLSSLHTISQPAGEYSHAQNMSYHSPDSTKEGNRLVRKQFQNKNKSPVETYKSAGTSSHKSRSGKVSSEINELPVKSGSPLHQLMGYNSPSQVLRGSDPSSSGTSSFYS